MNAAGVCLPSSAGEGAFIAAGNGVACAYRSLRSGTMTAYRPWSARQVTVKFSQCCEHSPMNVFSNTVVTITFKLFDASNRLIEEGEQPIAYLHGGHSGIFPKIEEALNQKKVGESISVTLEPADAFGDYDSEMIRLEPLANLPSDVA